MFTMHYSYVSVIFAQETFNLCNANAAVAVMVKQIEQRITVSKHSYIVSK